MTFSAQDSSASQALTVSTISQDIAVVTKKCFVTVAMRRQFRQTSPKLAKKPPKSRSNGRDRNGEPRPVGG
jgi:hypothetical protein